MIPVPVGGARRALVIVLSTAATALATAACGSAEPEPRTPIGVDAYVAVMSELADLERFPPSGRDPEVRSARADSLRRVILDRHGVTAPALLEFAETVGSRPDRMVEIVDRIVAITDSLARNRTGGGAIDAPTAGVDAGMADSAGDAPAATAGDAPAATDDDVPAATADDTVPLRQQLRDLRELRDAERRPSP